MSGLHGCYQDRSGRSVAGVDGSRWGSAGVSGKDGDCADWGQVVKGEKSRKLTVEETEYIRSRVAKGVCMAALGRKFDVSRQRVWQIGKS